MHNKNQPFVIGVADKLGKPLGPHNRMAIWNTAGRPTSDFGPSLEGTYGYNTELQQIEIYSYRLGGWHKMEGADTFLVVRPTA